MPNDIHTNCYEDVDDAVVTSILDRCEEADKLGNEHYNDRKKYILYSNILGNEYIEQNLADEKKDINKSNKYDTVLYKQPLFLIMKEMDIQRKKRFKKNSKYNKNNVTQDKKEEECEYISQNMMFDNLISDYLYFYHQCIENDIRFTRSLYVEKYVSFGDSNTNVRTAIIFSYSSYKNSLSDFFNMKIQFDIYKSGNKEEDGEAVFYTNIKTKELVDWCINRNMIPYIDIVDMEPYNMISIGFLNNREFLQEIKKKKKKI